MTDLEAEREQKQRDFDRKLLLAKSKIEMEEASVTVGLADSALEACSLLPISWELGVGVGGPSSLSDSGTQGLCGLRQKRFPAFCLSFPPENRGWIRYVFHFFLFSYGELFVN